MRKMIDLEPHLKAISIYILTIGGRVVVIDGKKNSTGLDIALLFSKKVRAMTYARNFPSLQEVHIVPTSVSELIDHFKDRVEYFILDRPGEVL